MANITVNMENLTTEEREQLMTLIKKSNKPQSKLWKPKHDEVYWYIDGEGYFRASRGGCSEYEEYRLDIGNCFHTKEEALFEVERLKVIHELKAFAKKENVGDFIIFYEKQYGIQICKVNAYTGEFHFESRKAAQNAIDTIGEERLRKYYFCVE